MLRRLFAVSAPGERGSEGALTTLDPVPGQLEDLASGWGRFEGYAMDLEPEDYDNRTLPSENGTEMATASYDPDWGDGGNKTRLDDVQVFVIGLYSTISLLGFMGNMLILMALMKKCKQKTIVNFFIGNLAFSDILVVLFCSPFTLSALLLDQWVLGELMCRLMPFLQCTSVLVSTLILISIAIVRYQRIKYPLSKSLTIRQGSYLVGLSWAIGFVICSPLPIFYRLVEPNGNNGTNTTAPKYVCIEAWPKESYRIAFSLCLLVVQYILPLICLIVSHTSVCRSITCKMSTREMKKRLEEKEKRERKEKKEKEKREKKERKEREKREKKEGKGKKDMIESLEMKDMRETKEMMGRDPSDMEDDYEDDLDDIEDLEGTMDMKDIMELRELKRELRERRDRRERMGRRGRRKIREMRELEAMENVEEVMDITEMIEMKEINPPRNVRDMRDVRDAEEIEDMIDTREVRDMEEIENMSDTMEMRDMGHMRDPREMRDMRYEMRGRRDMRGPREMRDEMRDTKQRRGRSWKRGRRGKKAMREMEIEEIEEIEELGSMYGMYEMEEMEEMHELGELKDPNTGDDDLDDMEGYAAKNSGHHIQLPKFQRWSYTLSRKHRKMYNKKSCVVPVLRHPPPPPEAPPKEIEEEEEEAAEPERCKLTNASKIIPGVPICFVIKPEEKQLEEPEMLTISRSISRIRKRSRRVVYRLTILIIVFAVSWMPLHLFHVVTDFNAGLLSNRHFRLVYCICHLLGMLSCCLNPVLYGFLNNGIKADLMALLRCV
ncbi:neuropeptide Y receptor type 5 isoform X2 [Dromiciops gliroides]|uniref:neuropeptide Y receptor type 5 isoform X2 n=1 Tax=Dromiciops gliroides TaxID=33562 RepID=UPI001CC5FABD|nr:neuropeptide Y receptor type 5 isoform X2 [Dromiciops gliroides]